MEAASLRAACVCGKVMLEARGKPITTLVCYCDDCQAAGRQIEALPGAPPVLGADGGTGAVMFCKDRLRCLAGAELLVPMKLRPQSPTNRYVAQCCNSALYAGFDDAKHWVDVFRDRVQGEPPPINQRIFTRFAAADARIPNDAPRYSTFSAGLIAKLLAARLAMLFGR